MHIQDISLTKLIPSPANVRKTGASMGIDELAASIKAHGLLQNLQVRQGKGGKFEVVAGGRRLAALRQLAKGKAIPKDSDIPCHVLEDEDASEISLAENVVRLPMHPADQYDAFKALADAGNGPEEIAGRFGCTATVVKQRLKLASVSPRLLAIYRAGEMNLDQLMAFTVSDDHAAQETAWFEQPEWNREPDTIRRVLTEQHAEEDDPRVLFVGVDTYVQAGGAVLRDLFETEHEGYLTDVALLDRLVAEKLESEAATLRSEGWKWVEISPRIDHQHIRSLSRIEPEPLPIDEEREDECSRLGEEYDALIAEHGEEQSDEIAERLNAMAERIDILSTPELHWLSEDKARSGVVIGIDASGRLAAFRGLVRDEDAAEAEASSESEATHKIKGAPKLLSDKLVEDLTAERTAALQAVMAGNAHVALIAVVRGGPGS